MPENDERWVGRIESLTKEGLGVGTAIVEHSGKKVRRPVFVPYAVPGDTVAVHVTHGRGKYLFGEIDRVVAASPFRVLPPCPHFGTCGGCDLEHVAYDEQLRQKGHIVTYLLRRAGIPIPYDVAVLPAAQRHRYRKRARVAIRFDGVTTIAGFRKGKSHEIVPITECFIVHESILWLIGELQRMPPPVQGVELELTAVVGDEGKLGLLIPLDLPERTRQPVREALIALYARNRARIGSLFFEEDRVVRSAGQVQEHTTYQVDGFTIHFAPETFIQANLDTNETLVDAAMRMLIPDGTQASAVIDLYAGVGNLSLPLSRRAARVVAVEGFEASVILGRLNAMRNHADHITFLHRSTERYLRELSKHRAAGTANAEYPDADALVLDPPRTGLGERVARLVRDCGIRRVLYVSCEPETLAEDLKVLRTAYRVTAITGVDMFPDISHVETVVLLERTA